MNIQWLLLLVTFAMAEKQIKLEDIERDNLISERRANREQEQLATGQTQQHLRTPSGASYEQTAESGDNDLSEDIVYAQPPSGNSAENYVSAEQQGPVQYVTPQQYDKVPEYEAQPTATSFTHPVHEATHTYSAPARQSLTNPIIHKPNTTPSPYLAQQPRYVYVQAGQQQVQPNGIITYGPPQHSAENLVQQQQKNAQDDINYANSVEQNNLLDTSKQVANAPARQQGYPTHASFLQYVPYLAQPPSIPNYVMVFRNPATHTQAYPISALHAPTIQYAPAGEPQPAQHLTAPAPTIAAAAQVLPVPGSTAIPTAALQFAIPATNYPPPHAHPIQFAAPIHLPPTNFAPNFEYLPPHHSHNSHQFYTPPTAHFSSSPLEWLHSLFNKQPTSLLDSYVPSSLLYAMRQRGLRLHSIPSNVNTVTIAHPTSLYQQGSHMPGYNTIAYSTAQGYSKRSPKIVNERPLKLSKAN